MGFPDDTVVQVQQVDDENWKLLRRIEYERGGHTFVADMDSPTDFASIPRVVVWLIPRYGRYTQAAIIHDYLWRGGVAKGELSLREADALFRIAMSELGVPFLIRWVMWAAVRLVAVGKGGPLADWLRTLPLVGLFFLLMLPVVGPPVLMILAALVLSWSSSPWSGWRSKRGRAW